MKKFFIIAVILIVLTVFAVVIFSVTYAGNNSGAGIIVPKMDDGIEVNQVEYAPNLYFKIVDGATNKMTHFQLICWFNPADHFKNGNYITAKYYFEFPEGIVSVTGKYDGFKVMFSGKESTGKRVSLFIYPLKSDVQGQIDVTVKNGTKYTMELVEQLSQDDTHVGLYFFNKDNQLNIALIGHSVFNYKTF